MGSLVNGKFKTHPGFCNKMDKLEQTLLRRGNFAPKGGFPVDQECVVDSSHSHGVEPEGPEANIPSTSRDPGKADTGTSLAVSGQGIEAGAALPQQGAISVYAGTEVPARMADL